MEIFSFLFVFFIMQYRWLKLTSSIKIEEGLNWEKEHIDQLKN